MRRSVIAAFAITLWIVGTNQLQAGGVGGVLKALLARAVVRGVVQGASHYLPKSYGPGELTVEQLAQCLAKAKQLDQDDVRIEALRGEVRALVSTIEQSSAMIDANKATVDTTNRAAVDAFNAVVDRHNALNEQAKTKTINLNARIDISNNVKGSYNAECADGKRYYGDDLADAKKLEGMN